METFSDYLRGYLEEKEISWRKASTACGLDRSLLKRYALEGKIPKRREKVFRIISGLQMNTEEGNKILQLYEAGRTGEYRYRTMELIHRMYTDETIWMSRKAGPETAEFSEISKIYTGKEEICNMLYRMASDAKNFWFQSDETEEIFPVFLSVPEDCQCKMLLEINNQNLQSCEFEMLSRLFPYLPTENKLEVYAGYRWGEKTEENRRKISVFLSDTGLALVLPNWTKGIFVREKSCVGYYRRLFLNDMEKSGKIAGSIGNGQIRETMAEKFIYNENTKVKILYQRTPKEKIWVKGKSGFYIQDAGLVRIFLDYMRRYDG